MKIDGYKKTKSDIPGIDRGPIQIQLKCEACCCCPLNERKKNTDRYHIKVRTEDITIQTKSYKTDANGSEVPLEQSVTRPGGNRLIAINKRTYGALCEHRRKHLQHL